MFESCNGLDDDCDGTPDDGFPAPVGRPLILGQKLVDPPDTLRFSWEAVAGADRYDLRHGDLHLLRAADGDFGGSIVSCLEDSPDTFFDLAIDDTPGQASWYLVRAKNCTAGGTYDDPPSSGQAGSRDPELTLPCP